MIIYTPRAIVADRLVTPIPGTPIAPNARTNRISRLTRSDSIITFAGEGPSMHCTDIIDYWRALYSGKEVAYPTVSGVAILMHVYNIERDTTNLFLVGTSNYGNAIELDLHRSFALFTENTTKSPEIATTDLHPDDCVNHVAVYHGLSPTVDNIQIMMLPIGGASA